jgi:hypothetical protein
MTNKIKKYSKKIAKRTKKESDRLTRSYLRINKKLSKQARGVKG